MNHKNVIEINGKKYDPKSGALLSTSSILPSKQIDGIIKPVQRPHSQPTTIVVSQHQNSDRSYPKTSKSTPNPRKRRTIQKSQTLMRNGVKRPIKHNEAPHSIHNFRRKHNSSEVAKSSYVKKHSTHLQPPKIEKKETQLHVAPHPSQAVKKIIDHDRYSDHQRNTSLHSTAVKPSSAEQLIHQALADAPTSRAKKVKQKKAHGLGRLATVGTSAVLLIGFILYMNYGQIQMQFASSKAGFSVSSPGYVASGYSLSQPIKSEPGTVTLSFTSNTDGRHYDLTQEASGWNSASLQENYLKARNVNYRASTNAGRTIFIYDETNATWVSGGVWYTVTSDSLSSDQLVKIATSI